VADTAPSRPPSPRDDLLLAAVAVALLLAFAAFLRSGGGAAVAVDMAEKAAGPPAHAGGGLVAELTAVAWHAVCDAGAVLQRHAGKVAGSAATALLYKVADGLLVRHLPL
jgi:hypothetical protein